MRAHRELGQNFLVDRNILEVIAREAELHRDDVVLEIGGGEGVLSQRLAQAVGYLHVVEIDRRLQAPLEALARQHDNVKLHIADAMALDLAALQPQPNKLTANLPYGIAASVIIKTVERTGIELWVAMVQREVGERLAAQPGTSAYGAVSVIAQLSCEVEVLRRIARTVFRPVPNVDSVLLRLRRTGEAPSPELKALVKAAFAHRRKPLAGSLALVHGRGIRAPAQQALLQLGHPQDARAERLSPQDFKLLEQALSEVQTP